ncbi:MAG TPA: nucleotide disphospho-sugar-binding domain-containing protein [Balneolaceae bacterium]
MEVQLNSKTILVFPFNAMGHYLRCITLAKNYPDYNILFPSSSKYNKFVQSAGFETFESQHFDVNKVMDDAKSFNFDWLNEKDLYQVLTAQIEAINKFKPEFVIGDTAPTLKMACEVTNTKYVSVLNGYMSKYYTLPRPLPNDHSLNKLLNRLPKKYRIVLLRKGQDIAFYFIHTPFKKIRNRLNLKPQRTYLDELEGDKNFICDQQELFPQKKLPENYRIIGPLSYTNSASEEEVLSRLDPTKKTICVCMGSTGNWSKLEFLSDKFFSKFNIITTGDTKRVVKGNHIIPRAFLNLDVVLPKCDYFICHGGNGTIYNSLKHHTPLYCLPAHFEQEWNAERIEELGLGENINNKAKEVLYSL